MVREGWLLLQKSNENISRLISRSIKPGKTIRNYYYIYCRSNFLYFYQRWISMPNSISDVYVLHEHGEELEASVPTNNQEISFYRRVWFVYLLPCIIIMGIVDNILVFLLMSRKSVFIGQRSKTYYRFLSVLELVSICFYHVLNFYFGDGLNITTNGKFYIYLPSISAFHCKFWLGLWTFITTITEYTVMMYSLERCLAIMLPLRSRAYLNGRNSSLLWVFVVLPPAFYLSTFTSSISKLITNTTVFDPEKHNCEFFYAHGSFLSYCISSCGIRYTIHIAVVIICNILIMRKLKSTGHRRALMTTSICQAQRANRIFKSSKILVILSSLQGIIYFPALVVCVSLCSFQMTSRTFQLEHSNLISELHRLYFLTNSITLLKSVSHFFVYLVQIPSFRRELIRIAIRRSQSHTRTTYESSRRATSFFRPERDSPKMIYSILRAL